LGGVKWHLFQLLQVFGVDHRFKPFLSLSLLFSFLPGERMDLVLIAIHMNVFKLHLVLSILNFTTAQVEALLTPLCHSFQVWDLGGQERLRTSWATYYRGTHAVIAVIDSSDRARISVMKDELFRLLGHEDLQHSVVLVFANKQDIKDAMTPAEITDALSLHSIKDHDWHIQACCALTGEGLYDGLGWIAQRVTGKAPTWCWSAGNLGYSFFMYWIYMTRDKTFMYHLYFKESSQDNVFDLLWYEEKDYSII